LDESDVGRIVKVKVKSQISGGGRQMNYRAAIRSLRSRLPKNNQKGFTLIELLVVISILGILAAVVTMSLVGITAVATQRAAKTEATTVQVAYDTMLADQRVNSGNACNHAPGTAGGATGDMTAFPSSNAWSVDASGNPVSTGDTVQLYPHYLRENKTHGTYYCSNTGEITQVAYTP
jgi:prepilin-type N-terminal cleavage/methylation domain-containing protein